MIKGCTGDDGIWRSYDSDEENEARLWDGIETSWRAQRIPEKVFPFLRNPDLLIRTDAIQAADDFLADETATFLILLGGVGCGKTLAAAYVVDKAGGEVTDESVFAICSKMRYGRFMKARELQQLNRFDAAEMKVVEEAYALVLDDLGSEYADGKGEFASRLENMIDSRYDKQLRTVITSNATPETFRKRVGARGIDRINECGLIYTLGGKSLRKPRDA